MKYDEILTFFKVKNRYADRAQCLCPAHADKKASLTISRGRKPGKTVLFCHAGCKAESVLAAAGLSFKDLYEN